MGFALALCSCSEKKVAVKILNWNLETFFDGQFDGNEYSEFKTAKSGWSVDKYAKRLERLSEAIKQLDADILVFEELEKKEQIYDISNQLSGTFNFSKIYRYGTFATSKNAPIGCAILSRYPLSEISVHEIDFGSGQPSLRPIIQATITVKKKKFTLFVNHWKSKAGGAEASEFWRDAQEKNLSRLIKKSMEKETAVIATGDFNRDIEEFEFVQNGEYNIALKGNEQIFVHSPWLGEDGTLGEIGSYWFNDHWERIDHFFVCGTAKITSFSPQTDGKWTDSSGHPIRYKVYSGNGYSDHLPILCVLEF